MLPEQFHVVPVLDDPVREGVFQLVEAAFVAVEFLPDIGFFLVGGVGDHHIVLGPAHSASVHCYIEGKTKGSFSSPLKPTFMSPLP
jgi:hypothetical protein